MGEMHPLANQALATWTLALDVPRGPTHPALKSASRRLRFPFGEDKLSGLAFSGSDSQVWTVTTNREATSGNHSENQPRQAGQAVASFAKLSANRASTLCNSPPPATARS